MSLTCLPRVRHHGPAGHEHRKAVLTQILQVTRQLAAEKDLDRVLELIIRSAREALCCEVVSVFLFDKDREELYTHPVMRINGIPEIRLPWDRGIVGQAARERQTQFVDDAYADPQFCREFDRRNNFRTRDLVATPLFAGSDGQLLGVMELINRTGGSPFGADDAPLIEAFAAHAAIALERALFRQHYEEKLRLEAALATAREIQSHLFPQELPTPAGYEIVARSTPAHATGGDYYDALALPEGRTGLVIGDVCGHGLGASLLMSAVRAILRSLAARDPAPHDLMTELNRNLYADMVHRQRFTTLMYGVLDPACHQFRYSNAGHGPLSLHYQATTGQFHRLPGEDDHRGHLLGVFEEPYPVCPVVNLAPGDLLILGSDGIVETRRGEEQFGMERFSALVSGRPHLPLQRLLDDVFQATMNFGGGHPQDDLTLMLVRRR
jgi:serine phosphatase RsbU (regulator of sigma subunit)